MGNDRAEPKPRGLIGFTLYKSLKNIPSKDKTRQDKFIGKPYTESTSAVNLPITDINIIYIQQIIYIY